MRYSVIAAGEVELSDGREATFAPDDDNERALESPPRDEELAPDAEEASEPAQPLAQPVRAPADAPPAELSSAKVLCFYPSLRHRRAFRGRISEEVPEELPLHLRAPGR